MPLGGQASLKTTWISEGKRSGFNHGFSSTVPMFLPACYPRPVQPRHHQAGPTPWKVGTAVILQYVGPVPAARAVVDNRARSVRVRGERACGLEVTERHGGMSEG